jgi:hypothetical protein
VPNFESDSMRTFEVMLSVAVTAALAISGCFYDPDLSKISKADDEGEDTGTADTGNADAGGSDPVFTGLGMACDPEADDCAGYDADLCMANPAKPDDPGHCTIRDCDTTGCPDTYQCCDCSGIGMEIMCVPDDYLSLVAGFCSCS